MHEFSAMLHENDLVRTLMDSLPCGVMILDHQAQVVTINKALEKIIGPASQVAGKGAGQSIGCVWTLRPGEWMRPRRGLFRLQNAPDGFIRRQTETR